MIYKAVAVPLVLCALMFSAASQAAEGPRMARVLTNVSSTICTSPEKRAECYSMIAAVAEMSRTVGETAAICGDDVSSKTCIYNKADNAIIQNWYSSTGDK